MLCTETTGLMTEVLKGQIIDNFWMTISSFGLFSMVYSITRTNVLLIHIHSVICVCFSDFPCCIHKIYYPTPCIILIFLPYSSGHTLGNLKSGLIISSTVHWEYVAFKQFVLSSSSLCSSTSLDRPTSFL